jgi:hypothetical protein
VPWPTRLGRRRASLQNDCGDAVDNGILIERIPANDLALTPTDISDLAAYILSLR